MTHSWSIKDVNEEVILDFEVCLLTCKLVAQLKWGYYWLLFHWLHLSIASEHHDQVFLLLLQMRWKLRTDMFVNYGLPGVLRWNTGGWNILFSWWMSVWCGAFSIPDRLLIKFVNSTKPSFCFPSYFVFPAINFSTIYMHTFVMFIAKEVN